MDEGKAPIKLGWIIPVTVEILKSMDKPTIWFFIPQSLDLSWELSKPNRSAQENSSVERGVRLQREMLKHSMSCIPRDQIDMELSQLLLSESKLVGFGDMYSFIYKPGRQLLHSWPLALSQQLNSWKKCHTSRAQPKHSAFPYETLASLTFWGITFATTLVA